MKIKIDTNAQRDSNGYYRHPQLPEWDEGTEKFEFREWEIENQVKLIYVNFEDCAHDDMVESYFNGNPDVSSWKPICDDEKAILLSISDSVDGPVAVFVIPVKQILFYDTETQGFPKWKTPSGSDEQPHIVQIGALLYNAETRELLKVLNVVIKPDGWEIPEEVIAVHGITNEYAHEHGIPEKKAIQMLLDIRGDAERVAFNKTFDQRIVRIGLKRFFDEATQEKWAIKDDHHCAMIMAKKIMGGKNPKLSAAYKYFVREGLKNAHNALADTDACRKVYFACLDQAK